MSPRELWRRLWTLVRGHALDREVDEELQFHLAMKTRETGDRATAVRAVGNTLQWRERARDAWGWRWLDDAVVDGRYAVRQCRQNPGFTAVAVLTLAVGIGVNATVFTVTNAVLFKGFPSVARNDRILYIDSRKAERGCCLSEPDFEDWQAQSRAFEGMAVANGVTLTLADKNAPEVLFASQVSANAFKVIGQRPIIGRDFAASDETPGAARVAILSYDLWARRYGKDPAIVGQTIRMGGFVAGSSTSTNAPANLAPTTIVGVMARGFSFPFTETLWVPLVRTPRLERRDARGLWFAFGRLADGATVDGARGELDTIGRRLATAYPLTNHDVRPSARTFKEFWGGPNASLIYGSMWGAVGFVLLIACANLANLLLARAMSRSRELSVRIALGAGRWRIIRQLLLESVMLSAMGGFVGWWIAAWGVRLYVLAQPPGVNFDYAMDYRVLGYLVAISAGTGLLFGLAPATQLSKLDVNATLKDGGRGARSTRGRHLSALLVIGEMALALVLLTAGAVMVRSFLKVYKANLGVDTANVLSMFLTLPAATYPGADSQIAFYDRLRQRLETIPGVESIAFTSTLPTQPAPPLPYELVGTPAVDEQHRPTVSTLTISPGYFRTLGAAVVVGREFNERDGASGAPVVIVNQRFATRLWPSGNALGQHLRLFDGTTQDGSTVVGIVSNIAQNDRTGQRMDPLLYVPYRQKPRLEGMDIVARTRVPPGSLAMAFRREVQAMDADLPIDGPNTLTTSLARNYRSNAFNGALFVAFAAVALLLASVGLYAVIAHSVKQRTQEIGIRTAMGATGRDILTLVFKQGLLPVGIGLTIGSVAALAVTPLLKTQLVGVSPTDPVALAVAAATLVTSAALGCVIPACRAVRVDPVVALRHE